MTKELFLELAELHNKTATIYARLAENVSASPALRDDTRLVGTVTLSDKIENKEEPKKKGAKKPVVEKKDWQAEADNSSVTSEEVQQTISEIVKEEAPVKAETFTKDNVMAAIKSVTSPRYCPKGTDVKTAERVSLAIVMTIGEFLEKHWGKAKVSEIDPKFYGEIIEGLKTLTDADFAHIEDVVKIDG